MMTHKNQATPPPWSDNERNVAIRSVNKTKIDRTTSSSSFDGRPIIQSQWLCPQRGIGQLSQSSHVESVILILRSLPLGLGSSYWNLGLRNKIHPAHHCCGLWLAGKLAPPGAGWKARAPISATPFAPGLRQSDPQVFNRITQAWMNKTVLPIGLSNRR